MINTAIRQIAFHFFESRAHLERKNGELSKERLCDIWQEEMAASLGEAVEVGADSRYIWSQVGHFFSCRFMYMPIRLPIAWSILCMKSVRKAKSKIFRPNI